MKYYFLVRGYEEFRDDDDWIGIYNSIIPLKVAYYDLIKEIEEFEAKYNLQVNSKFKEKALISIFDEYVYYRRNWNQFPIEMLGKYDRERSLFHDIFIAELDAFSCLVEKKMEAKVPWRATLGNDRHLLGEFAEYIMDTICNSKERVEIVEAIIWAQDHRKQILHCVEESIDDADARRRIAELFNLNFNQAQAIIDMRVRAFNKVGRIKMQEELVELLEKVRPYEEWL